MKILIVDDNNLELDVIKGILSHDDFIDFTVELTDNTSNLKSYEPDLIILDLYMPLKNGIDICLELKACEETKNIPLVILSGSRNAGDKAKCYKAGALEYFEKPIVKDVLIKIIKKYANIGVMFKTLDSMTNANTKA